MKGPFGFIAIDKPIGMTSHDCVSRVRKVFGIKRVGHGGTLDPEVTGVLPIALGKATKLFYLLPGEKTYQGIIQLGITTTTDDIKGEILLKKKWPKLSNDLIEKYLDNFRGQIEQRPPVVSSVHIQGERAYKRFRRGEKIKLPLKNVIIHDLTLNCWDQKNGLIKISVHCSSGTYIRSLARDLGELIGCGACLAKLRRTQALGFLEKDLIPLPDLIKKELINQPKIVSPLKVLGHLYKLELKTKEEERFWRTGRRLNPSFERFKPGLNPHKYLSDELHAAIAIIDCQGELAGIGSWDESSLTIKPRIVFDAYG